MTRSPAALGSQESTLLVVDVQAKLISLIHGQARIVWNLERLMDAAKLFAIPTRVTEQYPQGLGPTVEVLRSKLPPATAKVHFSCAQAGDLLSQLHSDGRSKVVVAGIETHVCVQQTVLDLLTAGLDVYVPADAVGSRYPEDHGVALRRMESSGATITTTESVLFEWCERSDIPQFKEISALIRKAPPA